MFNDILYLVWNIHDSHFRYWMWSFIINWPYNSYVIYTRVRLYMNITFQTRHSKLMRLLIRKAGIYDRILLSRCDRTPPPRHKTYIYKAIYAGLHPIEIWNMARFGGFQQSCPWYRMSQCTDISWHQLPLLLVWNFIYHYQSTVFNHNKVRKREFGFDTLMNCAVVFTTLFFHQFVCQSSFSNFTIIFVDHVTTKFNMCVVEMQIYMGFVVYWLGSSIMSEYVTGGASWVIIGTEFECSEYSFHCCVAVFQQHIHSTHSNFDYQCTLCSITTESQSLSVAATFIQWRHNQYRPFIAFIVIHVHYR